MLAEAIIIGGIGAVAYTALDHENMLPWSQTVEKKWFWEKPPFVPTTPPARFLTSRPINTEEIYRQQQVRQQQMEEQLARRQSKYTVSDYSSPAPAWKPYQK